MKLTAEYRRTTEQFKDLQIKFQHFELVDTKKFSEVWAMKEAEVVALARRVMAADKVLHEQQLGLTWRPPADEVRPALAPLQSRDAAVLKGSSLSQRSATALSAAGSCHEGSRCTSSARAWRRPGVAASVAATLDVAYVLTLQCIDCNL